VNSRQCAFVHQIGPPAKTCNFSLRAHNFDGSKLKVNDRIDDLMAPFGRAGLALLRRSLILM
jgi:hypothetical protein